jgi:tetratricopeptide (TPR) repeat protein
VNRRAIGIATAVGLAAALVHARSGWFSFTDLDDRDLVVDDHAFLADPANLVRAFGRAYMHVVDPTHAYYRPLVTVSYGLDAQWSGTGALGYHLTNVALHAIASILLFAVLRRFAPATIAAVAALFFAVHPALAAAVAWIPGRNDSLMAVFALAAWLSLLRDRARASHLDRVLHMGFFALATLTKETAVVLPLVWSAQEVALPWPRERRRDALAYVSGWAALIGAVALVHHGAGGASVSTLVKNLPQLFTSLGTIVLPFDPTVLATPEDLSPWPGMIAAIALAAATWFVRGVRRGVVGLGLAAFALPLVPVLAVPGTLVLDSRLYMPTCGFLLAAAEILRAVVVDRPAPIPSGLIAGLSGAAALLLSLITQGYEESFRDPRAFARAAVEGAPHSALAHFCLGKVYQTDGDDGRALAEYQASLALGPGEVVHNNIAVIYMHRAQWADAERELRDELALDPRYARAYANLSIVLRREGRFDEADAAADTARRLEAE